MDRWDLEQLDIATMSFPVRCSHCRRFYDMGTVTITGRWLDCTAWKAPCCGAAVDDRKPPWTHRAHYEELR